MTFTCLVTFACEFMRILSRRLYFRHQHDSMTVAKQSRPRRKRFGLRTKTPRFQTHYRRKVNLAISLSEVTDLLQRFAERSCT